jgi:hypothetical protein
LPTSRVQRSAPSRVEGGDPAVGIDALLVGDHADRGVDDAVRERGRPQDVALGLGDPLHVAGRGVECVEDAFIVGGIDGAVDHGRRSGGAEGSFVAKRRQPSRLARLRVDGVERAVLGVDVDNTIGDCRREHFRRTHGVPPAFGAGCGIEGDERAGRDRERRRRRELRI